MDRHGSTSSAVLSLSTPLAHQLPLQDADACDCRFASAQRWLHEPSSISQMSFVTPPAMLVQMQQLWVSVLNNAHGVAEQV